MRNSIATRQKEMKLLLGVLLVGSTTSTRQLQCHSASAQVKSNGSGTRRSKVWFISDHGFQCDMFTQLKQIQKFSGILLNGEQSDNANC